MLILVFVMGLRKEIGVDYDSYERMFDSIKDLGFLGYYSQGNVIEPGYVFLNYLVSLFNLNYNFLLFVSSFITIYFFYYPVFLLLWYCEVGYCSIYYILCFKIY